MLGLIYALNFAFLLSCIIDMWCKNAEQRFSAGIVRTALIVPLLALGYLYLSIDMQVALVAPIFFSEDVFSLAWLLLALNMRPVMTHAHETSRFYRFAPVVVVLAGLAAGGLWIVGQPDFQMTGSSLIFPHYGRMFASSLFVLAAMLMMAWRLEAFWRSLDPKTRKPYKYLLIGFFLLLFSLGWSTSYRLTYLQFDPNHLLLLSLLLFLAWVLSMYAVVGSRLLNRKIFVSRKIVYSTIAPLIFSVYLISAGLISLLMRTFGWSLHFVLQWLLIVSGLLVLTAFAFSSRFRARVRYFISTHFYINKYEYRDEWLNFSQLLHHKLTEAGVVQALQQILRESLYTDTIRIWVGDERSGFLLADPDWTGNPGEQADAAIPPDHPLVSYLKTAPYLNCRASLSDAGADRLLAQEQEFLDSLGLDLLVPLAIGGHFVGIIGLGPEYTGGRYAQDDFDLLAAIGSQAASALLSVRMAEELAKAREQSAWNTLSTFVLHDIKNAATMLSLVQKNAPQHIHKPEFQEDMLESVSDALKRIHKVQTRLNTLKGTITPTLSEVNLSEFLRAVCTRIGRRLSNVSIDLACPANQTVHSDPEFLGIILENLILNAAEACSTQERQTRIQITAKMIQEPHGFQIECRDNGPGISPALLPDRLFEPFISAKAKGSGIGLWQVKSLVTSLGGHITARNADRGGARFLLNFPQRP